MKRILISAMHSGAGKTVFTCALLRSLKRRGMDVRAFKCGPDYIDPMFHSRVLGIPSRNLDYFLQGTRVQESLLSCDGEIAVLEGAMGYYDGLAGSTEASAWDLARITNTSVILVLRPAGVGISLAAQVRGMVDFRANSHICGLILADCTSHLASYESSILERETGLPVLGYLPPMEEARLPSRHLGLLAPEEITDLSLRFDRISDQLEHTVDLDRLLTLAAEDETVPVEPHPGETVCRIAVARDPAFCFYYEENYEQLRKAGAELVFFSPLKDSALPDGVHGLYLGGGYPENFAEELSRNKSMLQSIRNAILRCLPTVAECGGFLYLQNTLEDLHGVRHPMCGVLNGIGFRTERLQRFGYLFLDAETDSMLLRKGERIPAHEFHYWDCTVNGEALSAIKPDGRSWRCGVLNDHLYAAFPHLHFGGKTPLAERFVKACEQFEGHP